MAAPGNMVKIGDYPDKNFEILSEGNFGQTPEIISDKILGENVKKIPTFP